MLGRDTSTYSVLIAYVFVIIDLPGTGNRIKGKATSSAVPQSKAQLQDYHSLHLLSTMMLHKSLVPFIVAFTAATGVVASATPVARDGCNTGTVSCCKTITYFNSVPLGVNCVDIIGGSQW
jgi:hypothetical protein